MSDDEAMLDTEDVVGTVGDSDNEEIDDIDCIEMTDVNLNEGKNKVIITNPEKRVSKNKMTKYELVRIIGERIKQLTIRMISIDSTIRMISIDICSAFFNL